MAVLRCERCKGKGYIRNYESIIEAPFILFGDLLGLEESKQICPHCDGKGYLIVKESYYE
jgi:DnaJ-class molecular chaperone